jgi:hypothetical protein
VAYYIQAFLNLKSFFIRKTPCWALKHRSAIFNSSIALRWSFASSPDSHGTCPSSWTRFTTRFAQFWSEN